MRPTACRRAILAAVGTLDEALIACLAAIRSKRDFVRDLTANATSLSVFSLASGNGSAWATSFFCCRCCDALDIERISVRRADAFSWRIADCVPIVHERSGNSVSGPERKAR